MVYIWCGRSMVLNHIIFCFVLVKMWWIKTTPDLPLGDVEVRRLVHLKILGDYGSKGENAKTLTKQEERNWPDHAFRPAICQVGPCYTDKISNNVNPETWLALINPCSRDNIISKNKIKISMACRTFFYVHMKMCLSFACERYRIPRIPFFTVICKRSNSKQKSCYEAWEACLILLKAERPCHREALRQIGIF